FDGVITGLRLLVRLAKGHLVVGIGQGIVALGQGVATDLVVVTPAADVVGTRIRALTTGGVIGISLGTPGGLLEGVARHYIRAVASIDGVGAGITARSGAVVGLGGAAVGHQRAGVAGDGVGAAAADD